MAQKNLSPSPHLQVEERDQAGQVVTRYIASGSDGRVDVIIPENSRTYTKAFLGAFLPAGYPQSVTEDYLEYQIYDSLQAFSSSIAGLLASRAVLEGVGVGDASASPTAALLLSVLQDSMGRIATILFAHKLGTSLEPECKMYRLAADVFNDAAMILDCLSPAFPKPSRVMLLSFSSILRALCGVAAGSSKASLSAHFATEGNLGELNAKDASQETIISLLGMLAGSVVVSHITSPLATWSALLILLYIHLWTNYKAVHAVSMRTLNRQRANIVFSSYIQSLRDGGPYPVRRHLKVAPYGDNRKLFPLPAPNEVSPKERIFELDGVLRWHGGIIMGHCSLGVPLRDILDNLPFSMRNPKTGSYSSTKPEAKDKSMVKEGEKIYICDNENEEEEGEEEEGEYQEEDEEEEEEEEEENATIEKLFDIFRLEKYILWYSLDQSRSPRPQRPQRPRFMMVLKENSTTEDHLRGWFNAFLLARRMCEDPKYLEAPRDQLLKRTLKEVKTCWPEVSKALQQKDWDLQTGALETRPGVRVRAEADSTGRW